MQDLTTYMEKTHDKFMENLEITPPLLEHTEVMGHAAYCKMVEDALAVRKSLEDEKFIARLMGMFWYV